MLVLFNFLSGNDVFPFLMSQTCIAELILTSFSGTLHHHYRSLGSIIKPLAVAFLPLLRTVNAEAQLRSSLGVPQRAEKSANGSGRCVGGITEAEGSASS